MTSPYHLRDYTTLDLMEADGSTTMAIAGITDVVITPSFTIDHLDTADSVKAVTRKQREFRVQVDIGYAKFADSGEDSLVQYWLDGSGGNAASSLTDTSDPQTFVVSGDFDAVGGSDTINTKVENITFEEIPALDMTQDDFMARDLSGTGEDMTLFDVT